MKTPHKHAELIKAWADGAEIQIQMTDRSWVDEETPTWWRGSFYRIKPEPDVVYYGVFDEVKKQFELGACFTKYQDSNIDQLKVTFDGETGKLKSAEVL